MQADNILVIGANGQIGTDLVARLQEIHGPDHVVASDLKQKEGYEGKFEVLNVLDKSGIADVIKKHQITQVYQLAALLSATAEDKPELGWDLNTQGVLNILVAAKELGLKKVFIPSTIAAFGPNSPKNNTPQYCTMDPTTVYGVTKLAMEGMCNWYYHKYGIDVRSIRYPGLISWKAAPGGGTTDYAIAIYHAALKGETYSCFLNSDQRLPMMYMEDAIRGTIQLMDAPGDNLRVRTSYNFSSIDFTPAEQAKSIQKILPEFQISYQPDFRQEIARNWPQSINDNYARVDWGWEPTFDLDRMSKDMLDNIKKHS